jgi:hypothetical protein
MRSLLGHREKHLDPVYFATSRHGANMRVVLGQVARAGASTVGTVNTNRAPPPGRCMAAM